MNEYLQWLGNFLFSIGSTMIFAHFVFLMGVNSFKETTRGAFTNSKSIYNVTRGRSIIHYCTQERNRREYWEFYRAKLK